MEEYKNVRYLVGLGLGIIFFIFLTKGGVGAVTIYVDAGNNRSIEDGTLSYPFNTIQEGINAAKEGDTFDTADIVAVAPGIYYTGNIQLKHNVRLIGSGPETTIIDFINYYTDPYCYPVIYMPYHAYPSGYIEGFTIRNAQYAISVKNSYSFWQPCYLEVRNCIIKNCNRGISACHSAKIKVFNTVFTKMPYSAITGIWTQPIELTNVTIDNVAYAGEGTLKLYQATAQLKNTIVSNSANLFYVWGYGSSGYINAENSCFWNYSNEWRLACNNLHQFNNVNPLYSDPMYADTTVDNFHLQAQSPCLDKGVNVGLPYSGSAPDIGAYEYIVQVSADKLVKDLASSYATVSIGDSGRPDVQRREAMDNKFMALLHKLETIEETKDTETKLAVYRDLLDKLMNDIWAKSDGYYGGNPKNDWLTTKEEQDRLYPKVEQLKEMIDSKINELVRTLSSENNQAGTIANPQVTQSNCLKQNYPNPFNPSTTIEYSIAQGSHVTLKLYNVAGQLVATLVDEYQTAGEHKIFFDGGKELSRGIYYYQLKTDNFIGTKKMVVLR